jgi:phosphoribosyl 1,2-cyclic phosphodiesterase
MRICPLASGSKGNCYYLETDKTKLLIDAGLSIKETEKRLEEIDLSLEQIDAVLVTHEHMDHIKGLKKLSSYFQIPIFCNAETAKGIFDVLEISQGYKIFSTGQEFAYKDLSIIPFSIQHDTLDPVAFKIQVKNFRCAICTDLGVITPLVQKHLEKLDLLIIESNHEPHMVQACLRPKVYKDRVLSRQGHLCNDDCIKALEKCMHPGLKHIFLAHLSEECNNADLALKKAKQVASNADIHIAFQDKISSDLIFS